MCGDRGIWELDFDAVLVIYKLVISYLQQLLHQLIGVLKVILVSHAFSFSFC